MAQVAGFKPCLLIPIYNNKDSISRVLAGLESFNLPCLIVNDGSNPATKAVLDQLEGSYDWVRVRDRSENGGKGAAVKTGLQWARDLGHTNAIQIDADGQHETTETYKFVDAARSNPEALVLGSPIFGDDVPKARLYGRELSKFWVRIETLSGAIVDPLFGFRVYPVAAACDVLEKNAIGSRMDFDPEIAVRLCWAGAPIINVPTPVYYPEDGISHFHMVRDNIKITWMHTRLVCGMLIRLPRLLMRRRAA